MMDTPNTHPSDENVEVEEMDVGGRGGLEWWMGVW